MPKDLAMPIETLIGQNVRPRSCRAEPAAPRQLPAAAKRSGRRQGEGLPTPVNMADRYRELSDQFLRLHDHARGTK